MSTSSVPTGLADAVAGERDRAYKIMNGKGDSPRPVNGDIYRRNFDDIFRKQSRRGSETQESARGVSLGSPTDSSLPTFSKQGDLS